MNETRGDFQLEESTLVLIDASIYEARSGSAEGTLCQMVFEDGTRLKVKPFIHVSLENIDVIGQEDDGTIKLAAAASGKLSLSNENSQVLFEGEWRVGEERATISVRQHMVADIAGKAHLQGTGKGPFEGKQISGEFLIRHAGVDSAGFGIFKFGGKGTVT